MTIQSTAISARALGKTYNLYARPYHRLMQALFWRRKTFFRPFIALDNVSFDLDHGDVLGVVGRNGAGKSTLLQLICGTLRPTSGSIAVNGRIAALLELGAGFNPEFNGRENVFLNAAILGLSHAEIEAKLADIIEFSGIGKFIDQPVKTYSSGMYVRLAFSVAVHVDPDILIIDEALSVGDGVFARKSFERVMELKSQGKTIIFCSHSLYHIEAICNKALWLEGGTTRMLGTPDDVMAAYKHFIDGADSTPFESVQTQANTLGQDTSSRLPQLRRICVRHNDTEVRETVIYSGKDDIHIEVHFSIPDNFKHPNIGISFNSADGRIITSAGSHIDRATPELIESNQGRISVTYPKLPLLKGDYWIHVYLFDHEGIQIFEEAPMVCLLHAKQTTLEQGFCTLPHYWTSHSLQNPREEAK